MTNSTNPNIPALWRKKPRKRTDHLKTDNIIENVRKTRSKASAENEEIPRKSSRSKASNKDSNTEEPTRKSSRSKASNKDSNTEDPTRKSSRSEASNNDSNNEDTDNVLTNSTNPHLPAKREALKQKHGF